MKRYRIFLLSILGLLIFFSFVQVNILINSKNKKEKKIKSQNVRNLNNSDSLDSYDNIDEKPSKYKGNQLKNGSSPLTNCFGKGLSNGNAELIIKNGSSSDAIVCIEDKKNGKIIRNKYIRKDANLKINKIPKGNYRIKVFYGNDWNPELLNPCGSVGYFESDVYFSEFDETIFFKDDENGFSINTLTLFSSTNGNISIKPIRKEDFFK